MRVLCVFGTRPEAIKLAPVVRQPQLELACDTIRVCVTAQHRELLDQMLDVFTIVADYDLNVMIRTGSSCKGIQRRRCSQAPTTTARDNLLEESVPDRTIVLTGNTVVDALHWTPRSRCQPPCGICCLQTSASFS